MIGGGSQKITVEIGGKIAASLGAALRGAQTQVSSFGRNVNRSMNDAAIAGKKGFKGIFDNALWQQATIGATAFAGAIGLSVREAMKFDSAMADIRKAIDFKDGQAGVKRFGRELIKLSTELPYTAEQLTKIAASAGFAGYAEKDIIPFTKSAAAMGVAFQMTAEEAGDAMVAMRASMGLTQPQVEQLGDTINYLSDKFQGTVNAADLTEVTRRIGAIGKASGLAKEEIAGLGAAFLASGTPVEVAGTGLKNFLNALTKGDQATKKQSEALETLFGSDVSDKLAKGMQKDAEGTIKSVIQAMAKLSPDKRVSVAGALFGEESKAAIMPLLTNTKLLDQAFDLIADKSAFAGSMQKEFQNQMGTSAAQAKIFRNGISAVGISVGAALLPSLNKILKAVTPLLVKFGEWAQKNEGLVTTIVLIGGALSGLVIALPIIAGVVSAIGTIGTALTTLKIGATIAGYAGVIGPAMGAIVTAITGPIGIAVLAIIGIGLAFKAAYDKIPAFRNAVNATMTKVGQIFTAAWTAIKGGFQGFITWVGGAWKVLTGILTLNPSRITEGFGQAFSGITQMAGSWLRWMDALWPGFARGAQNAWSTIVAGLQAAGAVIKSAWNGVVSFFQQSWSAIMSAGLGQFLEGIKAQFSGLTTFFQGVWGTIVGIFTLDAGRAVAGVKQAFSGLDKIGAGLLQTGLGLGRLIVTGIVAGVRGIGAAITGLGRLIVSGLQAIVSGLQAIGTAIASTMAAAARSILATWRALPGRIVAGLRALVGGVRSVFDQVVNFIKQTPAKVVNVGKAVVDAILNGLKSRASALFGWIRDAWSNINGLVSGGATPPAPALAGGATPAATTTNKRGGIGRPPGRALGGPVSAGMSYVVGEKRRELFVPGMDGAIIPRIARPVTAPKTLPININPPVPQQAHARRKTITINAPITINATGDSASIREQVRAAFEDLTAMASSDYRVVLND